MIQNQGRKATSGGSFAFTDIKTKGFSWKPGSVVKPLEDIKEKTGDGLVSICGKRRIA